MFNTGMAEFDPTVSGDDVNNWDRGIGNKAKVSIGGKHIPVNFELRMHYNRWMLAFGTELGVHLGKGWVERYPGTDGVKPDSDGEKGGIIATQDGDEVFKTRDFNFLNYVSLGLLLGKDAGIGLGPRVAVRLGRLDLPRANQLTFHGGYTLKAPGIEADGRIRPFIDADFRVGMIFPQTGSLQLMGGESASLVQPTFGMTAGVGTTF
jgi:hypothetical protein